MAEDTHQDAAPPTRGFDPSCPTPGGREGPAVPPAPEEQTSDFCEPDGVAPDERSFGSRDTTDSAARAAPPDLPRPLPGRYRILGRLARGGMGVIYRVWDQSLRRLLAMKIIRDQEEISASGTSTVDPQSLARFLREAAITGQLDHPGVVPVHEIGTDEHGRVYFTMRLVQGESLGAVLDRVARGEPGWTQTRALDVLIKVCETLAFAHSRGVIHRDLKPDNIMVGRFGETYVMDWGLARVLRSPRAEGQTGGDTGREPGQDLPALPDHSADVTVAGAVVGTPLYMPPEQADGRRDELDERADVYAVGAMLYRLLTGQAPYAQPGPKRTVREILAAVRAGPPRPVRQLSPRVPAELVAICEKAMARRKADRYLRAQDMADDLRAYLENRVVRAYRTGAVAEFTKWVARNRLAAAAGAVALLAVLGGLAATLGVQSAANQHLLTANRAVTKERDEKEQAFLKEQAARQKALAEQRKAEGLYLARQSSDALAANPGLALLLGLEAADRQPGFVANNALYAALAVCREERTLLGHTAAVRCAAFSLDGMRIVTASSDGTACVWDAATGRRTALLVGHTATVMEAVFSADGKRIVTTSWDGTAAIWDAASGACRRQLRGHTGLIEAAAFSPGGRRVATAGWDQSARIWDTDSGKLLHVLSGHTGPVQHLAFSPDGARLLTGAADKTARLWDAERGTLIAELRGHEGGISAASFSPDGRLILTAAGGEIIAPLAGGGERRDPSRDHVARLWEAATGTLLLGLTGHTGPVFAAVFSPDGRRIATGGADRVVRVWDVGTGRLERSLEGHDGEIRSVAFSPDGRQIAVVTTGRTVNLWDVTTGERLARLLGHDDTVHSCAFSPDGSRLVTSSSDRTARLWRTSAVVPTLTVPDGGASLRISPDGRSFLTLQPTKGKVVSLWSLPAGRRIASLEHAAPVLLARFSPDGTHVCTVDRSGTVRLCSADLGRVTVLAGVGHANNVEFSKDGRQLLVWAPDSPLATRWDVNRAALIRRLDLRGTGLHFASPGARYMLAWPQNGTELSLWDTQAAREVARLPVTEAGVTAAFSPDENRIVTWVGGASRAQLWSTQAGARVATLAGHRGGLVRVKFSADARRIVTTSEDGTARLWDAATGKPLVTLTGGDSAMQLAELGPGGERLVTRSQDRTARLWDVAAGQGLALLGGGDSLLSSAEFRGHLLLLGYVDDPRVALWDAAAAVPLAVLTGHRGAVTDAALTPDGHWLVTAARDRTVRIWPTSPEGLARQFRPRELTPEERDRNHVGTADERAAYRRDWDRNRTRETRALLERALAASPVNADDLRARLRATPEQ